MASRRAQGMSSEAESVSLAAQGVATPEAVSLPARDAVGGNPFASAVFDPIQQRSVAEQVAQRLLSMIRGGALQRGQRLPAERDLATMLGVGRPAVREAIRGLSLLGLLKIRQGEGTFVGSLSPRELLEPLERVIELNAGNLDALFDARIVLESSIASFAAVRIDDATLARLRAAAEQEARQTEDPAAFALVDLAFHEAIIEACGNPYLQSMAASLQALGKRSRALTASIPTVLRHSRDDHMRILDALAARDPERAAEAMRAHLTQVRDNYFKAHPHTGELPVRVGGMYDAAAQAAFSGDGI